MCFSFFFVFVFYAIFVFCEISVYVADSYVIKKQIK